ncbi:MAG: hypothetical protein V2A54_09925 [Bacteroidota bacterium]
MQSTSPLRPAGIINPIQIAKSETEKLVCDSVKKLINEIGLCEYFISQDFCYKKEFSKFIRLTTDSSYQCFLFVTDGGSGGQTVHVYKKIAGKYQKINDFFAFFEKIPGTTTMNYYDINLAFRDYDRGMVNILFTWNGKKYIQSKILSVNYFPLDLLIACGITDKNKLTTEYPFVGEKAGFEKGIYGYLHLDTLKNESGTLLLSLKASANYNYGIDNEWKVKFENGKYRKL